LIAADFSTFAPREMHGQSEMLHHFGGCIHAIQPSPAALRQPLNPSHLIFSLKTPCFAWVHMARVDIYVAKEMAFACHVEQFSVAKVPEVHLQTMLHMEH